MKMPKNVISLRPLKMRSTDLNATPCGRQYWQTSERESEKRWELPPTRTDGRTDGPQTYDDVLNIGNHQRIANESLATSPPACRSGRREWLNTQRGLARTWGQGSPRSRLAGWQTGAATVGDGSEVPQKMKSVTAMWPRNSASACLSEEIHNANLERRKCPCIHYSVI